MAFNVYPDTATAALLGKPANTPIHLTANESMTNFAPLAGNVGADPDGFSLPTTFVSIAVSGPALATLPHVEVMAHNPAENTDGPSKLVTAESIGAAQGLSDGSAANPTDAASAYFAGSPYPNNVYLLKVVIDIAATTLKLRITNDATPRNYVWVVADSAASSKQPWLNTDPNVLDFTALINQTANQTAQAVLISNSGTGSLVVNGVAPAIAAPFVLNTPLPATLLPNTTESLAIGFSATVIGNTPPAAVVFNSSDTAAGSNPGHNNQLKLSGKAGKLEVALVLDNSGSMSTAPDGTSLPAQSPQSRWSELTSAAKSFLELLAAFGENKGTFGIVKFPGKPGSPIGDQTSYDLVPAQSIPAVAGMAGAKSQLDAVVPFNGTPINPGLQRALTSPAPYFATDMNSRSLNRRWMLLMTDGAWNDGGDPTTEILPLSNNKITVFAAGYGTAGEVNFPVLQAIAAGTGGQTAQVDTSGGGITATALANSFKTAIKSGLTLVSSPSDPMAVLGPGVKAGRKHPISITPYDSKATFMLNWNTPDSERMVLRLQTPLGEVIAGHQAGVVFSHEQRYQFYTIDDSYLRNDAQPASPRYGTWWMLVSSPELAKSTDPNDREDYSYNVMLESSLKLHVALDRPAYFAGDAIGLRAKLTVDGVPLKHAAVKLDVTAPGQSMDNWLAAVPISPEEYKRARARLDGRDASAIYVKTFAAQLKKIFFKPSYHTTSIPMLDAQNNGVYSATVSRTSVPAGHKLYVTAVGSTADGVLFRREYAVDILVSVKPDPKFTLVDLIYSKISEVIVATLRITPRDRFGNLILIDPAKSPDFVLKVENGEVSELVTTYDGTYSAQLTYRAALQPTISLSIGGEQIFRDRPLPDLDKLTYANQLVAFKPGLEGAKGANKHPKAELALGDIRKKPADQFVSLGAYGALTVGVKEGIAIARGNDDVTVFVQADTDLRPYLVEAQDAQGAGAWLPLGHSVGITQSFGLRAGRLDAASAIRITDTSGRTRDATMQPLDMPGVSIRGIGMAEVKKVSPLPRFAPSPNQFNPKFGSAGTNVNLIGSNFSAGATVHFGNTEARIVGTPTLTNIVATVPAMPIGPTTITVRTADGSVTSDDRFTVV